MANDDLDDTLREAIREVLLLAMGEWSEENYAAGWLIGLESRLHREGGKWETLGRAVGWPIDAGDGGWETWEEAGKRYVTPAYMESVYGPNWAAVIAARAVRDSSDGEITTAAELPVVDGALRLLINGVATTYRVLDHVPNEDETHTYYLERVPTA